MIMMEEEKVKRKVLASLLVIAVVAGLVGASTFAFFSDTEDSSNTFTAGTLDLQLRNDEVGDWSDGVTNTWSSPNWAPGDPEVVAELRMKNIGTTGAAMVRVGGENLAQPDSPNDIADHIYITTIRFTEGGSDLWGNLIGYYTTVFGDNSAPLTLAEFVTSPYSMAFYIGACTPGPAPKYCNPPEDYLPADGGRVEKIWLGFTFEQDAGNEYQGDSVSFDIRVLATDDTWILGEGGGSAGYAE